MTMYASNGGRGGLIYVHLWNGVSVRGRVIGVVWTVTANGYGIRQQKIGSEAAEGESDRYWALGTVEETDVL